MKTTAQLFHRPLLVTLIAITITIVPMQTQAMTGGQYILLSLILAIRNNINLQAQAPFRGYSVGDTFNTFFDPSRAYSPFTSYSSFNYSSSCGFINLAPTLSSLMSC